MNEDGNLTEKLRYLDEQDVENEGSYGNQD